MAIEIYPGYDGAYNRRGLAYYKLEDYQQAIKDFDEAIRLEPRRGRVTNRGTAYYQLGEYQRALLDFDEAIRMDAAYARAYGWRGNSYYELEQYQKAIDSYDMAIFLSPTPGRVTNRGVAYYWLEEYQRALLDFDEAIRRDPNYARAYASKADAHGRLGQEQERQANDVQACSLDSKYC